MDANRPEELKARDRQAALDNEIGLGPEQAGPALDLERGKPVKPQGSFPAPELYQVGRADQPEFSTIRTDIPDPIQPQQQMQPAVPIIPPPQPQTPQESVQENARNRANLRRSNLHRPPIQSPFTFEGQSPASDTSEEIDASPERKIANDRLNSFGILPRPPIDVTKPGGRGDPATAINADAIMNAIRPLLAEQTATIVSQLTAIIKEYQGYAS